MKKMIMLGMLISLTGAVSCNDMDSPGSDNQKIQREEDMDSKDLDHDEYDDSDIGTGAGEPSNVHVDPSKGLESGAADPSVDPSSGLEQGAGHQ
ncbi:MAG: hypothetical protein ACJ76H_15745 [Bacteriovoracaceae bacterium]